MFDLAKALNKLDMKLNIKDETILDKEGTAHDLRNIEKVSFQWREGKPTLLGAKTQRVRITIEIQAERLKFVEMKLSGKDAASDAQMICDELGALAKASKAAYANTTQAQA